MLASAPKIHRAVGLQNRVAEAATASRRIGDKALILAGSARWSPDEDKDEIAHHETPHSVGQAPGHIQDKLQPTKTIQVIDDENAGLQSVDETENCATQGGGDWIERFVESQVEEKARQCCQSNGNDYRQTTFQPVGHKKSPY